MSTARPLRGHYAYSVVATSSSRGGDVGTTSRNLLGRSEDVPGTVSTYYMSMVMRGLTRTVPNLVNVIDVLHTYMPVVM